MRTFKLTLAYDGNAYAGWQLQPGQITLQGTLEQALEKITREFIRVAASGRTDAGVHALGQVVSFRSNTHLTPEILLKALNAELPRDLAALNLCEVPPQFHATRDALRKRYRYQLDDGPVRDVFARAYVWQLRERVDADAMHRAAQALVGTHDFASFQTHGSPRDSSVRTVYEIALQRGQGSASDRVTLEIEGNGFLYNMVRAIVGTLVEVGRGVRGEAWPAQVLSACDRKAAGQTAPPQGLFLVRVDYE